MGRFIRDNVGKEFGWLTVESFVGKKGQHSLWLCRCRCGALIEVDNQRLVGGRKKSCGCKPRGKGFKARVKVEKPKVIEKIMSDAEALEICKIFLHNRLQKDNKPEEDKPIRKVVRLDGNRIGMLRAKRYSQAYELIRGKEYG